MPYKEDKPLSFSCFLYILQHDPVARKAVQPSLGLAGPCCPEKVEQEPKITTATHSHCKSNETAGTDGA